MAHITMSLRGIFLAKRSILDILAIAPAWADDSPIPHLFYREPLQLLL